VSSATGRRQAVRGRRPVSAVVIWAGLAAGAGLRCCQAAISGGPASAAATATPASHHPAADDTAPPGITALASAAPATAGRSRMANNESPSSIVTARVSTAINGGNST